MTFQDYFVKFKDFKALNLVQSNSRLFKTLKALNGPCISQGDVSWPTTFDSFVKTSEGTVEVGVKGSFNKKLVSSRLKWAGHVDRMGDVKLAKRGDAQNVEGKRRRKTENVVGGLC